MVGVDNGIGLLAVVACHHYHDHNTLMRKLEDDVKKHRVVCLHLNGYNIFVKRCSLEHMDGIPFSSILEFVNYSLDKKVFEKKRVHIERSPVLLVLPGMEKVSWGLSLQKHQTHIRIVCPAKKRRFTKK